MEKAKSQDRRLGHVDGIVPRVIGRSGDMLIEQCREQVINEDMESRQNVSPCGSKASHVRRLNFGQAILTLNVLNEFGEQRGGRLLLDRDVAMIPCTEKSDLVRKWVETHENRADDSCAESSSYSPILGTTVIKRGERSPILGKRPKRARRKPTLNDSVACSAKRFRSDVSDDENRGSFARVGESTKTIGRGEERTTENHSPMSSKMPVTDRSPILDKNSYSYKRKRRKMDRGGTGDRVVVERKAMELSTNTVVLRDVSNIELPSEKRKIMCSQKQWELVTKLESYLDATCLEAGANEDPEVLSNSIASSSPVLEDKLNIEESPRNIRDNREIEGESDEESENTSWKDIHSDSEKTRSDLIEDVDSQDVEPIVKKVPRYGLTSAVSNTASIYSETSNKDSDKTFCSKAEQLKLSFKASDPSQLISEVSSQINDIGNSKLSQADVVISTDTSPRRTKSDPAMFFNVLDSAKKKRKPKKGSLSEKLQSLIGKQISFVRIWRHQVKQIQKSNATVQCITIFVQKCSTHYGRQFLEGFIVEDPFSLLPNVVRYSPVIIMTIPDIVGTIEMKSEGIAQIFPPWEILDEKKVMLNVMYINIVCDKERVNLEREGIKDITSKRTIVKDFDCACINANSIVSMCRERFGKPDVLENLFMR